MTFTLSLRDGSLYAGDHMLMFFYPAGDCDRCSWPLRNRKAEYKLGVALYDARETGDLPFDCTSVVLPDGRSFDFEEACAGASPFPRGEY